MDQAEERQDEIKCRIKEDVEDGRISLLQSM